MKPEVPDPMEIENRSAPVAGGAGRGWRRPGGRRGGSVCAGEAAGW